MRLLRSVLPFLLLAGLTLAAYWNAWPDTLVQDDKVLAGGERFAHLSQLPNFFRESLWANIGFEEYKIDLLYRPVLLVSFAIDAALFPDNAAAWHLVNVLLHVLATLLVYVLILRLLSLSDGSNTSAWLVALLAAMIFGVHPIHTEVVNSIFNRSILLVAIGTTAGLWWLLRYLDLRPGLAWAGLWLAYWSVLFSRETGVVLPALAVVLVWTYTNGGWRDKARRCLPALTLLVPLLVYLAMRARAIAPMSRGQDSPQDLPNPTNLLPAMGHMEWSSLLDLAGVWLGALRLALWPRPLLMNHPTPDLTLQVAGVLVHIGMISAAYYLYRRNSKGPFAALMVFYIALLPSSRMFGSGHLSAHIAERYLYVPSIGLTLLLAFGLCWMLRRGDRLLVSAAVALALCLLTPLTWARNAQWASEVTLYQHDYDNRARTARILQGFTIELLREGRFARVAEVCRENEDSPSMNGFINLNCGSAFAKTGDMQRAEQAFIDAAENEASRPPGYASLSYLYMLQGRPEQVRNHLENAIRTEGNPATRAYLRGLLLVRLHPRDEARLLEAKTNFEEALSLQPEFAIARIALDNVNRDLESLR